MPVVTASQFLM